MQKILVTGGAGFIGSHLVRALVEQGCVVRVLDNLSSGAPENLEAAAPSGGVELRGGDIRDAVACRKACGGVDTVFHMAALVSVPQSVENPIHADAVNAGGTLNVLLAARDMGVKRLVFSSSSAVYGDTEVLPTHEGVLPRPTSPYGAQKLTGEHYARLFWQLYGLETVALRYFNVYGPRQNPDSPYAAVIPRFLQRLSQGKAPIVFGDGEQTRDFCYVEDVVRANILAATTASPEACGGVFNVANGVGTSLNDLLRGLEPILGRTVAAEYAPPRVGDILHSRADISSARAVLGYRPEVALADGLARVVREMSAAA